MELNMAACEAAVGAFADRIQFAPTTGDLMAALRLGLEAYEKEMMSVRVAPAPASQHSAWIAVEDQMPPKDQEVLVYLPNKGDPIIEMETWGELYEAPVSFSSQTICTGEGWERNEFEDITQWMPLPLPPDQTSRAQRTDKPS